MKENKFDVDWAMVINLAALGAFLALFTFICSLI
jgi:hypothetical protein